MPTIKECFDTIYVAAFHRTMDIDNIKYEDTPFEATKQKNYNFLAGEFNRLLTNGLNNYDALVYVLELSRKKRLTNRCYKKINNILFTFLYYLCLL